MMVAQVVTLAGAAIALQVVLPPVWSGFQLVPGDSSLTSTSGAANAVVLGVLLLTVTTAVNAIGVRLMSVVNSVGVTCELVGVALLCVALFSHAERGPGIVLQTHGVTGHGYLWAFAVSGLMAAYVLVGFDSAGELSEETRDPRRTTPRTILRAVLVSGLGGALMLLATLMAASSVTDGSLGDPARGLPYVLTSRLGDTLGRVFLVDVAIAVSVCTLAIQTSATRMVFSMARDRVLPFASGLSAVNRRTGTPVRASAVVAVLAAALLLVNVGNAALFTTIASVCIMLLYLAYLMVTLPLLVRRLRGGMPAERGLFSLGRWGVVVNGLAVVWGALMAVNLGWPRAEVFDPAGGNLYLQWFAPLFLIGTLLVGALAYAVQARRPAEAPVLALEGAE
jgi:urea carboxylase system permease